MLRGLLSLATMTVTLYSFRNLAAALAAQVIVWGGVLCVYDLRNARFWQSTRPQFDRRILIGLFWLALPLGIVAGLSNLSAQAPRYAMEHFWGQRELGIFSAIASLGFFARLVTMALSRSALPRLSRFYAQDDFGQFVRLLLRLMGIGVTVGALGIMGAALFGKSFLSIVYTEEYAAHTDVLLVVMASVGVVATFTFLGTAVAATQQFAVQALVHVAKLTAIGIACYVLVPRWGALGAAWAVLIGALVSSPVYFFIIWRTIRQTKISLIHEVLGVNDVSL
jgi:O-antigen/teichoic acid export membrane protein